MQIKASPKGGPYICRNCYTMSRSECWWKHST